MTHFSDGELQAYLDGELEQDDSRDTEHHLQSCEECRAALRQLEIAGRVATHALKELDTLPEPGARIGSEVCMRAVRRRVAARRHRRTRRRWALAASVVLAFAASVAVPASPLRAWFVRAWEQVVLVFQGPSLEPASSQGADPAPEVPATSVQPPSSEPGSDQPAAAEEVGLHAQFSNLPLRILLHDLTSGAEVQVVFVEGTQAGVFAAADSRFTSGPGRLEAWVSGERARVEVPRAAGRLLLLAGGQSLLEKDGDSLSVRGTVRERDANGILFVIPGG